MNKIFNIRTAIGLACIIAALVLAYKPSIGPRPIENDLSVLNIEKPSDDILQIVTPMAQAITDPTDKAKLAIFNQEFSTRLLKYDTDIQKLNDVYVLAASTFFEDSLKNKYDNLDTNIIKLIELVTTDENHTITPEEKEKISKNFLGFSWALIYR
jgi:hypothetical protein